MNKPRISSIVALAKKNRAIGNKNKLLWFIPEDMHYFRDITLGHPVIMGKTTYESIGRPLPNRLNIILSKDDRLEIPGVTIAKSIDQALDIAKAKDKEEIFIIGGASIYQQTMNLVDRLYITEVEGDFEADTYFPDYLNFTNVISKKESSDDKYKYTFLVLEK